MEQDESPVELSHLPEEIIEKIITYLNLSDLKIISQTSKYLYDISGRRICKTSKIHLWRLLTHVELKLFRESRRHYENVEFDVNDFANLERIIFQAKPIQSIYFHNIYFSINWKDHWLRDIDKIFRRCNIKLRNICLSFPLDGSNSQEIANRIKRYFPNSNITFKLCISPEKNNEVLFDAINIIFKPIEINFNRNIQHLKFYKDIENVKHLTLNCDPQCDLKYFKKVESLYVYETMDLSLLKKIIENNKKTLRNFRVFSSFEEPWDFELPCQLSEFVCVHPTDQVSAISTDILRNQRHLRFVFLSENKITNDLLDTLSRNSLLSGLDLKFCCLDKFVDTRKFEFMKNLEKICFVDGDLTDFTIMKTILEYAEKVNWLYFEVCTFPMLYSFKAAKITKKVFSNLKIMKMDGVEMSKYAAKRIVAPNLEFCDIDCFPEFLFSCTRLSILRVGIELDFKQVVKILENIPSLETVHLKLKAGSLENSFKYILENICNIGHFRLDSFSDNNVYNPHVEFIIEGILKDFEFKWKKWESIYYTNNFSFEVYDC